MRYKEFRVWDKKNLFMETLTFPWAVINGEVWNITTKLQWLDIELMEYTGYKAENGDLCEGDLINDNMEVYWNYSCNAWAVRKFGDGIMFALLYKFITNCDEDNIKILGNIYE